MSSVESYQTNYVWEFSSKIEGASEQSVVQIAINFIRESTARLNNQARYRIFKKTAQRNLFGAVAKAAFIQDARHSSKHIQNIALPDESERFEPLKIRLAGDADKGLDLTRKFGIQSLQYMYPAAARCAEYDGWRFSQDIQQWKFKEEEVRFKLAMHALRCKNPPTPQGALRFISNYQLTLQHVFEVFSEAVTMKVYPLHSYLEESGMDQDLRYKLGLKFAIISPQAFLNEIIQWKFTGSKENLLQA